MEDLADSKSAVERRVGSNPTLATIRTSGPIGRGNAFRARVVSVRIRPGLPTNDSHEVGLNRDKRRRRPHLPMDCNLAQVQRMKSLKADA